MNLQDLCERIVRDAIPTTDSGATCFVPRYQIDQLREALSAPQPPASEQGGGEAGKEVYVRFNGVGEGGPYPLFNGVCVIPSSVARKLVASAVGEEMKRDALSRWAESAPPSAPVVVEGFDEWYDSVDARFWNNWDACNAAFHAGKREALAQQPTAVDGEAPTAAPATARPTSQSGPR